MTREEQLKQIIGDFETDNEAIVKLAEPLILAAIDQEGCFRSEIFIRTLYKVANVALPDCQINIGAGSFRNFEFL